MIFLPVLLHLRNLVAKYPSTKANMHPCVRESDTVQDVSATTLSTPWCMEKGIKSEEVKTRAIRV